MSADHSVHSIFLFHAPVFPVPLVLSLCRREIGYFWTLVVLSFSNRSEGVSDVTVKAVKSPINQHPFQMFTLGAL